MINWRPSKEKYSQKQDYLLSAKTVLLCQGRLLAVRATYSTLVIGYSDYHPMTNIGYSDYSGRRLQ